MSERKSEVARGDLGEPVWLCRAGVDAMHDMQLAEHGGSPGTRDEGLLESALARPRNAYAYGEIDLCALAASYAFGVARNHPYIDGNKRTAFLATYAFLHANGLELTVDDAADTMVALAAGQVDERTFSAWLRAHADG